jgi:hypothetical protein
MHVKFSVTYGAYATYQLSHPSPSSNPTPRTQNRSYWFLMAAAILFPINRDILDLELEIKTNLTSEELAKVKSNIKVS